MCTSSDLNHNLLSSSDTSLIIGVKKVVSIEKKRIEEISLFKAFNKGLQLLFS